MIGGVAPSVALGLGRGLFPKSIPEDYLRTASSIGDLKELVKISSKPDFNYVGKNVAVAVKPNGVGLEVLTDYASAEKELENIHRVISLKFPDKAIELVETFVSMPPKEDDITDPRILTYHLQTRLGWGLNPLFIPDNERKTIIGGEAKRFAEQVVNHFKKYGEKKGIIFKSSPFSEFAADLQSTPEYRDIINDVRIMAYNMLKAEDPRKAEEFNKQFDAKKRNEKIKKYLVGGGLLVLATGIGGLVLKHQLDEQAKKPYKEASGTDEQINQFISKYPQQNGNSTWIDFFRVCTSDKTLAEETFELRGSLRKSLDYIHDIKELGSLAGQLSQLQKDENYWGFVHGLSELPEADRKILNGSSVLSDWVADRKVSSPELRMTQDLDLDGITNGIDRFPINPLNDKELANVTKTFVVRLADYNKDRSNATIVENYGRNALKSALDAVEGNPKIIGDLNKCGYDWLVWFLKDNKGDERYWQAVNAFGQLAQVYFYDMNFANRVIGGGTPFGLGVNGQYDEMERSLVNERWSQLKDWSKKGELLIPIDGVEKSPWSDEKVYINNLKGMILPYSLFWQRIDNPNEQLFDRRAANLNYFTIGNTDYRIPMNSTKAIEMALNNVRLQPQFHDIVWARLTDSQMMEEDINFLRLWPYGAMKDWPTFMRAFPEILDLFTKEGTFYDKALVAVDGIAAREITNFPDIEPQEFHCSNLLSSIGGAGYTFLVRYPMGPVMGHWHSTAGYPISDYLARKLYGFTKYGKVMIHKDTNSVCFWLFEDTLEGENKMEIQYPFRIESLYEDS